VTLAETQALFHEALTSADPPAPGRLEACFAGTADLPAPDRLAIYASMYAARRVDALRQTFPELAAVLGDERFAALARDYASIHPSSHHDIARLGHALPAFLREHPGPGRPDLGDLAALEWQRQEAFFAAPATAAGRDALARLAPDDFPRARLVLAPAVRLLELEHDPTPLWRALQAGAPPPSPSPGRCAVAIWRNGFEVVHARLPDAEAEALRRAAAGSTLGEVCEAFAVGAEPARAAYDALSSWVAEGWVAAVGTDASR